MSRALLAVCGVMAVAMTACSSIPVTQVRVQSYELQAKGVAPNAGLAQLIGVFVDNGFDVKISSPDSGVVTTEYKKFASMGDEPPFDFYMQIRTKLKASDGGTSIQLTPVIKEQNRMNVAAFTERELVYFVGEPGNVSEIESMSAQYGWRVLGNQLFMKVVNDAAAILGVGEDAIVANADRGPANARDFEDQ